jgi:chaperone modulatory protein CbpM
MTTRTHYALARPYLLSLDSYARLTGVHPDMVLRMVAMGLLEVSRDGQGRLWFDPTQVRAMARIQRLHLGLSLSYTSLGLIVDLLDRVSELERSSRRPLPGGEARWT